MNATLIAAFVAGFASISAHAAGPNDTPALDTIQASASPKLVVECSNAKLPGYGAVGALLDTNNSTVLYAARESMRRTVQHDCTRGVGTIAFALADRATPGKASEKRLVAAADVTP
jgi:hypothetical protein